MRAQKHAEASERDPDGFVDNAQRLFAAMAQPNGKIDFTRIEWFNGGLFDDDNALPLTRKDIKTALKAANQDWSNIDPSIMGTLFERGLDPDKRSQLGAHYTDPEFNVYEGRVPAEAYLVCYWFARASEQFERATTTRVGLVSTNFIRGGANRDVLDDIAASGRIFEAWSDEPWIVDGAAVRVSITCFDAVQDGKALRLDGKQMDQINHDLTASATDLTKAGHLREISASSSWALQRVEHSKSSESCESSAGQRVDNCARPEVRPAQGLV